MSNYDDLAKRYREKATAHLEQKGRYDRACETLKREIEGLWQALGCAHVTHLGIACGPERPSGLWRGHAVLTLQLPTGVAQVPVDFTMPAKGDGSALVIEGQAYEIDSHGDRSEALRRAFVVAFAAKIDRILAWTPPVGATS